MLELYAAFLCKLGSGKGEAYDIVSLAFKYVVFK